MDAGSDLRILFYADTHLGFDYALEPKVERRRRGQDFFDNSARVLTYAADNKVDLVIHGGDLFFRSRVPSKIVDLAYGQLFEFAERGIPILIVAGNHERSELPTSLYLAHPKISVFVNPATFTFNFPGVRVAVSGFPFERRDVKSRFKSILARTGWDSCEADIKLLCFHQAVEGATVGPSNYTFRNGNDVIKMGDLPGDCAAVLAGHIHRRQVLTRRSRNGDVPVIYPGSTERTSFAEKNEEKGFYDIRFRRGTGKRWRINELDFVVLPARPMVDVVLERGVDRNTLRSFLLSKIDVIDKNSIVRLESDDSVGEGVEEMLTSDFLRDVFPKTMNYQFGSGLFRNRRKRGRK